MAKIKFNLCAQKQTSKQRYLNTLNADSCKRYNLQNNKHYIPYGLNNPLIALMMTTTSTVVMKVVIVSVL